MVSSPSAAAQAAENDKRRKPLHSMEKAKANHLTRQLQVRLQYARLKVERGWQKQNLNEVENLYFHNSHLRSGKPALSVSTQPMMMMTQPLLSSSSPSTFIPLSVPPTQLPNRGSIQNTSLHNIPTPTAVLAQPEDPKQDIAQESQAPVATATPPAAVSDAPIIANHSPDEVMQVDNSAATVTPSVRPEVPTSLPPVVHDPTPTIPTIPTPTTTLSLVSPQSPASSTNPTFTNHYAALKIPRTRNNKHPAGPKGAHQNLTAKEMLDFASTSTLTYDSFWSNHSASAPSSRPPRSVLNPGTDGTVGLAPAFNSGLFTNGFSAIDLSHFVNLSFNPAPTTVATSVEHSRSVP